MTVRSILSATFLVFVGAVQGQVPTVDTAAILILDRMSEVIGSLHSCSYTLRTAHSHDDQDHGRITLFQDHKVYLTGPDGLHVNTTGDKGHFGFWYDGDQVVYYSFTENNFGFMEAPGTIMETIDEIHHRYGVDMPGADVFYPTFVDDLIDQSDMIHFVGTSVINGQECFRVVAHGKEQSVQLWVANDATFLPVRFIVTEHTMNGAQYSGAFSDWTLNPDIPPAIYQFMPPPGASLIRIMPRVEQE